MRSKKQNEKDGTNVVPLWKPVGLTPLEALRRFAEAYPSYKDMPAAYAGRLDPMAEGILLGLFGNEPKNINSYLQLEKTYRATFVLGFATDTYDMLGEVTHISSSFPPAEEVADALKNLKGSFTFPLPPYSAYKVNGKPLFHWARKGMLPPLPQKTVELVDITIIDQGTLAVTGILTGATERIPLVRGDFRQESSLASWKDACSASDAKEVPFITADISCSSGTYIRAIAHELEHRLAAPVFLFSLTRTRLGPYTEKEAVRFDK